MTEKTRFIDVHVIQNLPPNCINRDDTGSPKTAIYGGVLRSRVSSQAWKRAIRKQFQQLFPADSNGIRTRNVKNLLIDQIIQKSTVDLSEDEVSEAAEKTLELAGIKGENSKDVLFFISHKQIDALADVALNHFESGKWKEPKSKQEKLEFTAAAKNNPSIDILLFGRMAAQEPSLNYDATCQVAHAISTHEIQNEFDYFTAVDDANNDDTGAGHLGTVEYNSSTLYRYATLNVNELAKKLDESDESEILSDVVKKFIQAFVVSMPTGKQNTFANRTLPSLVYVTLRDDQPINLVGAFERPVKTSTEGYVDESIKALTRFADKTYKMYDAYQKKSWYIGDQINIFDEKPIQSEDLQKMLSDVENTIIEEE